MSIYIFFCFFFGAAFTFSAAPHLGSVIAASLAGLLGSFLPRKETQAAVYTGAFAGMSSTYVISDFFELAIVALAGTLVLIVLERWFIGFGGKLGACAFLSVVSLLALKEMIWL